MIKFLKESCVESLSEAISAENNGANLIELCANLYEDGLTPSANLIKDVQSRIKIPLKVMIRPRKGNFEYSSKDIIAIRNDIKMAIELGVEEIVFGATKNNELDIDLIKKVSIWAKEMKITIHKAIDTVSNPLDDIEKLKAIFNVTSILTSGQSKTAFEGLEMLKSIKEVCGDDINLIPAGKITSNNVENLHQVLQLKHYHGRKIVALD
jgi:copper homeostasis protein